MEERRVIVLYTYVLPMQQVHLRCINALIERNQGFLNDFYPVAIRQEDRSAYWLTLKHYWEVAGKEHRDLIIIEQDIEIHDEVFSQFYFCPNSICAFRYNIGDRLFYGLGCTRFNAGFIEREPDAIQKIDNVRAYHANPESGFVEPHDKPRDWMNIDSLLWQTYGPPCVHEPAVTHYHQY